MIIPSKSQVVAVFEKIAQLLELEGENPFKIRAYLRAAQALEALSEPLEELVKEERLGEVDGIGKAIKEKITELMTTGHLPYYEELRNHFPATLFELFELQGLGAKKIRMLYKELKVASIDDLEKACQSGSVAQLAGFGPKSAANIEKAIAFYRCHTGLFRRDQVTLLAGTLLDDLRAHPHVSECQSAGSFRRGKEAMGDLDLLVSSTKPEEITQFFIHHPLVAEILMQGPTKSSVRLKNVDRPDQQGGIQCDLRIVRPEEFPFALVYFTGSKEHNIRLRSRALEYGWSLNEYGFTPQRGAAAAPLIHEERELYHAVGLQEIPPELREDRGEIAAAEKGLIPRLIELGDLKGTFHCHTTESDGQHTLLEMAAAAQELGLSYLGIADHSKSSVQAHGMSEERLSKQLHEIKKLNESFEDFHLFAGVECDILKEGTLDFSNEVLASLDYVVASVHSSFTLGEAAMTKRLIRAMENPYVTILGHVTGRILFSRESYPVNVPAVLDAAAATGTIIELNASPYRLDMDWRWWLLAKEKGVRCVINPDAHSTAGLHNLLFGVTIARKGWLTKNEVINTLSAKAVQEVLKMKKK
ncbi:MAG: DNA polymerase/3'-5' exonuclease PolX [Chthoniobacterales bacterium]|nr:DNA polymerase/3'-5' exonuclease PolX [Chthoniobacterales bacterium]